MTSLLVLASLLLLAWLWSVWQRDGHARAMAEWSYVPLVAAVTCAVMAMGIWLR
ncbi:MAG: hypothetical protein JWM86_1460 [Thermoleophilia bacterium]|nr:hypothetical protein [Thermoleophilia bacterium]